MADPTNRGFADGFLGRPFSRDEMAAIRDSLRNEERLGRQFLGLMRRLAKKLPFAEDALAAWFCARDPATPARVRYTLLAAIGYFVLPIDALPDFLPLMGFTDDAAVIGAAIATVAGAIRSTHRAAAREWLDRL